MFFFVIQSRKPRLKKCLHAPFVLLLLFHFIDHSDINSTSLKTCLWNPGTYRHKIVRLSSAQLSLVMTVLGLITPIEFLFCHWNINLTATVLCHKKKISTNWGNQSVQNFFCHVCFLTTNFLMQFIPKLNDLLQNVSNKLIFTALVIKIGR